MSPVNPVANISPASFSVAAAHGITAQVAATWSPDLPRDPRVMVPVEVEALVIRQAGESPRRILALGFTFVAGIFAWFLFLAGLIVGFKAAGGIPVLAKPFGKAPFNDALAALLPGGTASATIIRFHGAGG